MVEPGDDGSEQQQIQPILVGNISAQLSGQPTDFGDVSAQLSRQPNFVGNFSPQPQYIQLKYSPKLNFRYLSYGVIGVLMPISLYLIMGPNYAKTDMIGLSICCALPSVVFFLDAIYSHGKSEWEFANGMPNNKTRLGMVLNIVLGFISLGIFLFFMSTI